ADRGRLRAAAAHPHRVARSLPAAGDRDHRALAPAGAPARDRPRLPGRDQVTAFFDTLTPVLPEVIVTITACVVLVADGLLPRGQSRLVLPAMTVVGLALAFLGGPLAPPSGQYFGGFVQIDTFTTFFRAVFIVLAVFATLVAPSYLDRRGIPPGEYYATICFSNVGAMKMALSTVLITSFGGLDLMTLPIYVLAGMQRRDRKSTRLNSSHDQISYA